MNQYPPLSRLEPDEILAALSSLGEDPTASLIELLRERIDAAALPAGERADVVLAAVATARVQIDALSDAGDVEKVSDRPVHLVTLADGQRKLPGDTTIYQPSQEYMPGERLSSDVFLSLANGKARHPAIPDGEWLTLKLGGFETATIVDLPKMPEDPGNRKLQEIPLLKVGDGFTLTTDEPDLDENDEERITPAGSVWKVVELQPHCDPVMQYSVVCEATGGWIHLTHGELAMSGHAPALAVADRELPERQYLLFSQSEADVTTIREGFWSKEHGWGDFSDATRFEPSERNALTLPVSRSNDAKWVDADGLAPFFHEQEQRAKLAGAVAVLAEQAGVNDPLGANLFFKELLESVETLSGIGDQYGSGTLADLMYLQNAISKGTFVDHFVEESSVSEVVKLMPSADRWLKYIQVQEPEVKYESPSPGM
jgi:hypothetical protein